MARNFGTGDPSGGVRSESSGLGRKGVLSRLTLNRKEGRGEDKSFYFFFAMKKTRFTEPRTRLFSEIGFSKNGGV